MSNVNVNRSGNNPADFSDNPPRFDQSYVGRGREYMPPAEPRPDWRHTVALGAVMVVLLIASGVVYSLWKLGYCWDNANAGACYDLSEREPWLALGALGLTFGVVAGPHLAAAWGEYRLRAARALRTQSTFDRFGNPVRLDALPPLAEAMARYRLDVELKAATAPYEQYQSVNAFSPSFAPSAEPPLLADDGGSDVVAIPPSEWLGWINDPDAEPHVMIAGKTNSGKSTVATVLLDMRIRRGDDLYIIDPHYAPVDKYGNITWGGLVGVGGDSWESVTRALRAVQAEYDARKKAANAGQMPRGGFRPLTIIIDEVPEIYDNIPDEWERFSGVMGSGARKYSIYLIIITQSPLIKDIGGSIPKRENFAVIALNEKAKALIVSEPLDYDEKRALLDRIKGEAWAAAMLRNNELFLLDRADLPRLRPTRLVTNLWQPPIVANPADSDSEILEMLRALRAAGWKRDEVRASGLQFDNDLWSRAGR